MLYSNLYAKFGMTNLHYTGDLCVQTNINLLAYSFSSMFSGCRVHKVLRNLIGNRKPNEIRNFNMVCSKNWDFNKCAYCRKRYWLKNIPQVFAHSALYTTGNIYEIYRPHFAYSEQLFYAKNKCRKLFHKLIYTIYNSFLRRLMKFP